MSQDDFERWINEAVDSLPEEFSENLKNLEIMVSDYPTQAQIAAVGTSRLYGLYQGIPQPARHSTSYGAVEPDRITIFRAALVRDFQEPAALEKQVKHVLYHELAHHFGISDDRLHELGAY